MNTNRFTGEHSTILINFDHVMYAQSEGHAGAPITLYFRNGACLTLTNGNADMFREEWRTHIK